MAFVDRNVLSRIFGQEGFFGSQGTIAQMPETDQQRLIAMLAGVGSGMTQASAQPGAGFAQALGGGAAGMMQGQQQHAQQQYMAQQQQMQQMQMQQLQQQAEQEDERQRLINKLILGDDPDQDFLASVDAQPGGAQATPLPGRPNITSQPTGPYRLGRVAERYESSGRGVGTVSTGQNDPGGVSYGRYQISSDAGTMADFLQSPEGQAFSARFAGMEPGTPMFNQEYERLAEGNAELLDDAQRKYLMRTHFEPVANMAMQMGINVENPAIAEALFSQSLQHSGAGNLEILNNAAARLYPGAAEQDVINALYDARSAYASQFAPASATTDRYARERQDVLGLLGEVDQYGQEQVAAESNRSAPQPEPLANRLNLTDQEKTLLRIMDSDQQMAFIMQKAGMSTTKQPDKIVVAEQIAAQTGRAIGDVLAEMEGVGQYADGGDDDATTTHRTKLLQVDALMESDPSLTREQAYNRVFGRTQIVSNPVDGSAQLVDTISGEVLNAAPEWSPEGGLYSEQGTEGETPDVSLAFGSQAVFSNVANTVSDVLGGELPRPQVEEAIARVRSLGIQGDVLLTEQFAGRVSNQLLDMIGELKSKPASFFQGPSRGRERLEEMQRLVQTSLARNIRVGRDQSQGPQAVRAAREAAEALTDYSQELEAVLGAWGGSSSTAPALELTPDDSALIDRWLQ